MLRWTGVTCRCKFTHTVSVRESDIFGDLTIFSSQGVAFNRSSLPVILEKRMRAATGLSTPDEPEISSNRVASGCNKRHCALNLRNVDDCSIIPALSPGNETAATTKICETGSWQSLRSSVKLRAHSWSSNINRTIFLPRYVH